MCLCVYVCVQHLPAFFFRHYGDRFQRLVLLRGPSGQVWPVSLCVSCATGTGRPTVRFSRGWKQFAFDHNLELGDKLIFTLVSFSRFTVQLFDGYGKTKPATSEMADSGWTFQREGGILQNHGVQASKQKRSFYVNWKDRVVREQSAPGTSGVQESKKGDIQPSKTSLLYRHLKRGEKKKLGRKSGAMVLFRPRKQQEGKVRVLGQRLMIKQTDSHSSDDDEEEEDSETLFTEFLDAAGGEMVEWEPFDNTSSSAQTRPGFGNPSTSAAIGCKSKPTRPKSSSLVLECSSNSLIAEEMPQNFRNQDAPLFPAKVKMEEDTDMHVVFRVDPISSLAPLEGENVQEAPASPTISFSHYLHSTQPEEEEEEEDSNHGESHVVMHQYSPHKTVESEPDSVAADERLESYGISYSDKPLVLRSDSDGFVDEKPFHRDFSLSRDLVGHSGKVPKQNGGASDHEVDNREGGSRLSEKWGVQNLSSDIRIASAAKPSNPNIPPTFPERCSSDPTHDRTVINVDGAVSMPDSSNPTGNCKPESPSQAAAPIGRKDLSLAYFLNQPRPNVRKQNPQEKTLALKSSDGSHKEKNVTEMRPTDTDLSPMCADHLRQAEELRDAAAPNNNSVCAPHVAAHIHDVHGSYNVQQNSDTHDKSSGSRNFQRNSESKLSSEALSRRFADTSGGIDRSALLPRSKSAPVRPTESDNDFPALLDDHFPKTELKVATKTNSVTPHGTPGPSGDCKRSDDVTTRQHEKSSNRSFQRCKSALGDPERYSNSINRPLPWSDTELAENECSPTSVDHSPQTDFEHALQANSVNPHNNTHSYGSSRGYKHDIGVSLKSGDHVRQAGLKGTRSVNPEPISITKHDNVAAHTIVRGSDGEYTRPDVQRRFDDKSNSRGNLQDNHLLSKSSSPGSSSPAWSDHTEYDTDDFSPDSVDRFKRQSTDFGDDDSFKRKPVTTIHSSDREYKQTRIDEYLTLRKFRRAAGRCSAKDHTSGTERPLSWSDVELRPSTDMENLRQEEFKGVIPKRNPASDGEFMRPDVQTRLGDRKNWSGNFQELNLNPNSNSRGGAGRCSGKDHTSGIERPRPWSDAELRSLADLEHLRQEELKSSPKRNPVNDGDSMRPNVQARFGDRKNSCGNFQELNLNPNSISRGGAGRCSEKEHTTGIERPRPWSDAKLRPVADLEHLRQEELKSSPKRNPVNDGESVRPNVQARFGDMKNSCGNFQEFNNPNSRVGAGRCSTKDHTSRVERPWPWSSAELTPLTDLEHFRAEESKATPKRNSVNDGEFIRPDVMQTRLGDRKNSNENFQELNGKPHPNSRPGGAGRCFTGIDMKPSPCASAARNANTVSKPLDSSANEFSVLHYLADRKLQKRTYKKRIREDVINSLPTHPSDSHTTSFGRGPRVSESLQRKDNRSVHPNSWTKDGKRAPAAKSSRDENCPVISQEDAWLSEYLEQDPVAKKTTPKMKQSTRGQVVNLPVEQLRKLRPTWTYNTEQQAHEAAPRTTTKMGSRDDDKCQLIELDNISSSSDDDDDAPTLPRRGAQDGWDTWMDIFRKNAVVS